MQARPGGEAVRDAHGDHPVPNVFIGHEVNRFNFELSGQSAGVVMANSTRYIIGVRAEPNQTPEPSHG